MQEVPNLDLVAELGRPLFIRIHVKSSQSWLVMWQANYVTMMLILTMMLYMHGMQSTDPGSQCSDRKRGALHVLRESHPHPRGLRARGHPDPGYST